MAAEPKLSPEEEAASGDEAYSDEGGESSVEEDKTGAAGGASGAATAPAGKAVRRKIAIEYISDRNRRHITFSKRKAGLTKKAFELSRLTGAQVLLLVASDTGHVYTFATPKLKPIIHEREGRELIQACLVAPDPAPGTEAPDEPRGGEERGLRTTKRASPAAVTMPSAAGAGAAPPAAKAARGQGGGRRGSAQGAAAAQQAAVAAQQAAAAQAAAAQAAQQAGEGEGAPPPPSSMPEPLDPHMLPALGAQGAAGQFAGFAAAGGPFAAFGGGYGGAGGAGMMPPGLMPFDAATVAAAAAGLGGQASQNPFFGFPASMWGLK
eukprot:m51a1_g10728 putative mads-box transcription other eukaryote (322) ;mRNA; f:274235-275349